jgi:ABC-type transport system involved in Fe-S cluster assembly fused permease/ATPase subunit
MRVTTRPTQIPANSVDDWRSLRQLGPFLWRWRWRAGLAIGALVLSKLANVAVPLLLKDIVDALDQPENVALILPLSLVIAYGLMRAGSALFNELRDAIFARARHGMMRDLSVRLVEHLHQLSLRFHLDRKTGGITRDMDRGTRAVSSLFNLMLFNIVPTLVEVTLIAVILLAAYNPWFAIITFGTVSIYITFTTLVTNWRMKFRIQMNTADSEANTYAVDGLLNYETVKYFGNEREELQRYDHQLSEWENAAVRSQTSMSALNFGQAFIIAIGVTAIMALAAQGVVDGSMTLGDLVLVNTFLLQLFIPLGFLGIVYSQVRHNLADIRSMFRLFDEQPEITDAPNAKALEVQHAVVRFEDVHFAYEPERPILHGLSFEIGAGEKVAVVGPSGAGKSTLARLLFRFFDIGAGRISIDGQDIRAVTQESLRAAIGIVPQDTVLFNDTLYRNIAYARPNATPSEVEQAARLAHIHDFIMSLPQGYETIVGERGLKLSGGEKQRVAIARVFLKDPPILIFDEATSSLDSNSERIILQSMKDVAHKRTTLVIAHRLSTIIDADRILVIQDGAIREQGTHEALLTENGLYAELWKIQQR